MILGADITYDCKERTLEALLRLIESCSHPKTQTFLAHGLRNVERAMWLVQERFRVFKRRQEPIERLEIEMSFVMKLAIILSGSFGTPCGSASMRRFWTPRHCLGMQMWMKWSSLASAVAAE